MFATLGPVEVFEINGGPENINKNMKGNAASIARFFLDLSFGTI
jgi:hypothetical protein